jgi:hypothetical protein
VSVQADAVRGRVALLPLFTKVVRVPPPPRPGGWTLLFDRTARTIRAPTNAATLTGWYLERPASSEIDLVPPAD